MAERVGRRVRRAHARARVPTGDVLPRAGRRRRTSTRRSTAGARVVQGARAGRRLRPARPAARPGVGALAEAGVPVVVHCGTDRCAARTPGSASFDEVLARAPAADGGARPRGHAGVRGRASSSGRALPERAPGHDDGRHAVHRGVAAARRRTGRRGSPSSPTGSCSAPTSRTSPTPTPSSSRRSRGGRPPTTGWATRSCARCCTTPPPDCCQRPDSARQRGLRSAAAPPGPCRPISALGTIIDYPGARRRRRELRRAPGCRRGLWAGLVLPADRRGLPAHTFVGSDYHAESIELARKKAADAGVADRVAFEVATAQTFTGTGYDLVTMFDCLHDMGDPVAAAQRVRESLAPDGTWLLVEPAAGDAVEDNLNPVSRLYYNGSLFLWCPTPSPRRAAARSVPRPGRRRSGRWRRKRASPGSGRPPAPRSTWSTRSVREYWDDPGGARRYPVRTPTRASRG